MKKVLPALFVSLVVFFVISCGPSAREQSESLMEKPETTAQYAAQDAIADSMASPAPAEAISSSAAVENGTDTNRKYIRTADLKFRVPNVIKATYKIEDITKLNNGFVELSNLSSNVDYEENKSLTADSTLIITHFTLNNSMTLRVPNTKLDTTLKQIAPLVEFMDYRVIKATNVALDLLTNRLTQRRAQKHEERLSKVVDDKASKGTDVTSAAESMLYSQEKADMALISNFTLKDQINFSTITLQLYQRQSVKCSVVANEKSFRAYESGFWAKAWDALQIGFDIFKEIILFLIKIWWFILVLVVVFLVYPRIRKRKMPIH